MNSNRFAAFFLFCSFILFAQTPELVVEDASTQEPVQNECNPGCAATQKEVCPCLPEPSCDPCDDEKVVIAQLKGVLLVCSSKSVRTTGLEHIEGIVVEDLDIPGNVDSLYTYLKSYWCGPIRKCDLTEIKKKNHHVLP